MSAYSKKGRLNASNFVRKTEFINATKWHRFWMHSMQEFHDRGKKIEIMLHEKLFEIPLC